MSCILNIETSTDVCSVAVSNEGECIFNKEDHSGPNHAVKLGIYVDEALSFIDNHAIPLDAVAVSCGPGSYTGLRIGVSMAKGICYGRSVKLIAVPTLELMCVPVLLKELVEEDNALLCPMLDARRMEVYAQVFDTIIEIMERMFPQNHDNADYIQKLWDHLAIMSDFKLDIDYPFDVAQAKQITAKPDPLEYPMSNIPVRHYGKMMFEIFDKLKTMEPGDERDELVRVTANQMKRNLALWSHGSSDDEKVASDLARYTDGKIQLDLSDFQFEKINDKEVTTKTRKKK
jgi:tRNA threonylcarbamoyl adenosine modification protein YeaZ